MSEIRNKSKKVVNSIGVGIMAVLSSGTSMLQIASAADVGEVQNAGEMLENEVKTTSMNQGSIDALDNAGDAINTAQGSVSEAGDIQNGTEIQGELTGSANALGRLDTAVEKLEDANAAAAEAIEDYQYAVDADQYRDGAAENIDDAKAEAGDAQTIVAGGTAGLTELAQIQATDPASVEEAVKAYAERLTELTEVLGRVKTQAEHMSTDSEEMENLNRTLTGIATVYELQLRNISKQVSTIEQIDEQTRRMAQQIEELNNVYARMIKALTVNVVGPIAPSQAE